MTDIDESSSADRPDRAGGLLRRVRIKDYKSIATCDVAIAPLTILVGRNGAGKSNFLDALRFVADSLQTTLDHAMKARGGIEAVRRISTGHPRNFAIELDITLPEWHTAKYGFEIAARPEGGFAVKHERLRIRDPRGDVAHEYRIEEGELVSSSSGHFPPNVSDRLCLVAASSLPEFRGVYDALTSMGFYNLNPDVMKELQSPDAGELLHRDGVNIASVIARLQKDEPAAMERLKSYLAIIVPGIIDIDRASLGPRETLEFRQEVIGAKHPWRFYATSMSDGTLRTLGILSAVVQRVKPRSPVRLVGIEEPETALHPAAAGALMDALSEAASHTQIVVTSHSPDLLDEIAFDGIGVLVVVSNQGTSEIAPVDEAGRRAIQDRLFTLAELHRMDQLVPDPVDVSRQRQMQMFESGEEER